MKFPSKKVRDRRFTGKTIVVAWAEPARGPGWKNNPIWVICRDREGNLSQECLQPDEQNREMGVLYSVNAQSTASMTTHVAYWLGASLEIK